MSRSIEVETLAREIIKPSSPTPHHLRNLKLSLLDQIIPVEYTAVILFYRGNDDTHHHSHISQQLKQSLSEILKIYYPFAGIIKDHILIECKDNGVEYVEAQTNCLLLKKKKRAEKRCPTLEKEEEEKRKGRKGMSNFISVHTFFKIIESVFKSLVNS